MLARMHFVNATGTGSGGASGSYDAVENTGTGFELGTDAGSTLQLKTLAAGDNFEIIDNGDTLVFRAIINETAQVFKIWVVAQVSIQV